VGGRRGIEAFQGRDASQDLQATSFTRRQWHKLSLEIEHTEQRKSALSLLRGYVRWLYWSDILTPGIECALAWLLETNQIDVGAIWVNPCTLNPAP
jgi:hypothetical protein